MRLVRVMGIGVVAAVAALVGACAAAPQPPTQFATAIGELAAYEATFCPEAQQQLTGLDETSMPLDSIGNVTHGVFTDFIPAKATLSPLQTQTYRQVEAVADPDGGSVQVAHRISCKMRSSDHVATAGYPTQPDRSCDTRTQRSLDIAWDHLTAAERSAYLATGRSVALQPDRMEVTGPEWLNSFEDEVAVGDTLEVTAHALLIEFFDPAYAEYPETVRGVHYCTVWTPAWAYAWYRVGAFQS